MNYFTRLRLNGSKLRRGQAALSLVFLVGGTVVLIGATLTFLVISFINSAFGYQAANRALGVAMAGINDGLWQLSKDRALGGGVFQQGLCDYYVYVGSDVARVQVFRKSGACGTGPTNENQAWINSEATFMGRTRKIYVVASIDKVSGRVEIVSIKQTTTVQGSSSGYGD